MHPAMRSEATKEAGRRADRAAVSALIPLLRDEMDNVRCNAAVALGEIDDPAAVAPLIDALEQEVWRAIRAGGTASDYSAWLAWSLEQLTGERHGLDPVLWREYQRDRGAVVPEAQDRPAPNQRP